MDFDKLEWKVELSKQYCTLNLTYDLASFGLAGFCRCADFMRNAALRKAAAQLQ